MFLVVALLLCFSTPCLGIEIFPPVTEWTRPTFIPPPDYATKFKNCDVPCYFYPKNVPLVGAKTVYDDKGHSTTFMHTMEGGKHYPVSTKIKPGKHDALSTTSFESEVPLPYFSWAEYNIQSPQVDFDTAIKAIAFVARNCGSLNNREGLVKKLMKYIRVDAISSCLNNSEWPKDIERRDKRGAMRKYLFYAAFENECTDDYITEKLWGGLESGSLPIYYGAPNVMEHVPYKSIIHLTHENVDSVGPLLKRLSENKKEYDKYHKWRKEPLPQAFIEKYKFTHVHGLCRSCRFNVCRHDSNCKWDHSSQSIIY